MLTQGEKFYFFQGNAKLFFFRRNNKAEAEYELGITSATWTSKDENYKSYLLHQGVRKFSRKLNEMND